MKEIPALTKVSYEDVRAHLCTGDILMASGQYAFSRLIMQATESCWSHVALILRIEQLDRVMVLESIEGAGVRMTPLREYVLDFEGTGVGYRGRIVIARHRDFADAAKAGRVIPMAQKAFDALGRHYDQEDIGRIAVRLLGSRLGMKMDELTRDNEYICSEFVQMCYETAGICIQQDFRGFVSPDNFASDPNVELLFEIETKS